MLWVSSSSRPSIATTALRADERNVATVEAVSFLVESVINSSKAGLAAEGNVFLFEVGISFLYGKLFSSTRNRLRCALLIFKAASLHTIRCCHASALDAGRAASGPCRKVSIKCASTIKAGPTSRIARRSLCAAKPHLLSAWSHGSERMHKIIHVARMGGTHGGR
jgi:hypothetical protein